MKRREREEGREGEKKRKGKKGRKGKREEGRRKGEKEGGRGEKRLQKISKLLVGFLNHILPSAGRGSAVGWLNGTAFPLKPMGAMTIEGRMSM